MRSPSRRILVWTAIGVYLAAVHAALIGLVLDPDLTPKASARLRPHSDIWVPSPFWQEMVTYQLRLDPTAAGAVFFLGDSLTQSLDVGAIAPHAVNYGIGGDTIVGLSRRVPLYRSLPSAQAIVVAIGVNDLMSRDAATAGEDYRGLLGELPRGVPLVLSAVLPVDERSAKLPPRLRNREIARLDATIRDLCAERRGCVFVDAGSALRDASGQLAAALHLGDGVHLNAAGYRVWMTALAGAIGHGTSEQN